MSEFQQVGPIILNRNCNFYDDEPDEPIEEDNGYDDNEEKYDPVLPDYMIKPKFKELVENYLPMKIRIAGIFKNRGEEHLNKMYQGEWRTVSKDLRSYYTFYYKGFTTKKLTECMRKILLDVPLGTREKFFPQNKIENFQDIRLRPWEMMEGQNPLDETWLPLKMYLEPKYRVKSSAQLWLQSQQAGNHPVPRNSSIDYSVVNSPAMSYPSPMPERSNTFSPNFYPSNRITFDNFYEDDESEEVVRVEQDIDEAIKSGAPTESELMVIVLKKVKEMSWQQLLIMNHSADKILYGSSNKLEKAAVIQRYTKKKFMNPREYEVNDGPRKSIEKRGRRLKLQKIKPISFMGDDGKLVVERISMALEEETENMRKALQD